MPYAAFRQMTVPAQARPQLWRLAAGLGLMAVIAALMVQATLTLLLMIGELFGTAPPLDALAEARGPAGTLGALLLIAPLGITPFLIAPWLHGRSAQSLIGPWPQLWRQFVAVAAALMVLNLALALLPPWPTEGAILRNLPFGQWLALLPLTVAVLIVQCGAEEVLFRGYLQSQLAARIARPAVWLILPSALFALGHYAPNVHGGNAWIITLWAFGFGLAAADLTARAGTLGPALAFHLANNAMAIALIAPKGAMSGVALFRLSYGYEDEARIAASLPAELLLILAFWLTARLVLRR